MTTNIGRFCIAQEAINAPVITASSKISTPVLEINTEQIFPLVKNGSSVYLKYERTLTIDKFISTDASAKLKVVFSEPHKLGTSHIGVKVIITGEFDGATNNIDGTEVFADHTLDTYVSGTDDSEITFDVLTAADTSGDIDVKSGAKMIITVFHVLELAGADGTWITHYGLTPPAPLFS